MDSSPNSQDFLSGAGGPQGTLTAETSIEAPAQDQTSGAEEQGSEIPKEQGEQISVDTGDGSTKEQKGATAKSRAVTQEDIRKLQSTYDKRLAAVNAQLEAANNTLMQSAIQAAQVENMVFESRIQNLPADQQQAARAAFQARQQANIETARSESEKANMRRTMELLAPLARERVAVEIAQEAGVDAKRLIESDCETPKEMARLAKVIAQYEGKETKTQRTQQRQERKADVFEGAGIGSVTTPDLRKEFAGTGDLMGYFRKQNTLAKRRR